MKTNKQIADKKKVISIEVRNNLLECNRTFEKLNIASAFLCFITAVFYGETILGLVVSLSVLMLYYSALTFIISLNAKSIMSALITTLWPGVVVLVTHGLGDVKYLYFVFVFLLVIYQNYVLISLSLAWTLVIQLAVYSICSFQLPYVDQVTYFLFNGKVFSSEHFFWTIFSTLLTYSLAYILVFRLKKDSEEQASMTYEKQSLISEYKKYINFAKNITAGNLYAEANISSNDHLGKYLLEMRESIVKSQKKLEDEKLLNDYINIGVMEMDNVLRMSHQSLEVLSDEIIKHLVTYLDVEVGALFLTKPNKDGVDLLEIQACHSYRDKRYLKKTIEAGEGLIGTAYLEEETIYMTDIPPNYIKINTGLESRLPGSLLIVPLKSENKVIGILELASFKKMKEHQLKMVDIIGEHIASIFVATLSKQETANLLDETNRMTNQLKQKEKELNLSVRKMTNLNKLYEEKLQQLKKELRSKQIELDEKEQTIKLLHLRGNFSEQIGS